MHTAGMRASSGDHVGNNKPWPLAGTASGKAVGSPVGAWRTRVASPMIRIRCGCAATMPSRRTGMDHAHQAAGHADNPNAAPFAGL
jgi:hypothetical protein